MRRSLTLLLVIAALGAGCASAPRLRDERTTQPYAGWVLRGVDQTCRVERIEAQRDGDPPLRLNLVSLRSPHPRDARLLVLQPGILADHRTWRFLAPLLAEREDLLLIDPPGTVGCDTRDDVASEPPVWTPAWIGRHTLRAVDRWQRSHGDTRRLVLVAHSLGSAAMVRALTDPATAREMPDVLARIDGLVLFTLPDVLMAEVDATLERIAGLTDLEIAAAAKLGILETQVADSVYDGVVDPERRALRQEADRLRDMLATACTRHAAQIMLRRWRPLDADDRPVAVAVREIARREGDLRLPVLLIWGKQDDTLPYAMAARVAARLPRVERLDVADAKHSSHQERADLVAWRIAQFLSEHPSPPTAVAARSMPMPTGSVVR